MRNYAKAITETLHHRRLSAQARCALGSTLKAMCAHIFAIAFAFEIKLPWGNQRSREIIVVTSDVFSMAAEGFTYAGK